MRYILSRIAKPILIKQIYSGDCYEWLLLFQLLN